jgi:hypothetical protein
MPRDDSRKQFPAKRAALAAAFVCLLLGPLAYQRFTGGSSGKAQQDEALRRYGMSLQEVAAASGINFTHSAPVVDPKLANIAPMIASMGASVTIVDYDNDGWNDIYVTSSSPGTSATGGLSTSPRSSASPT